MTGYEEWKDEEDEESRAPAAGAEVGPTAVGGYAHVVQDRLTTRSFKVSLTRRRLASKPYMAVGRFNGSDFE